MITPPKIKMFWWQMTCDSFPSEENLVRHHVLCSPSCSFCGYSLADSIHVIFECPLVKDVWRDLQVFRPKRMPSGSPTVLYISHMLCQNPDISGEMVAATAWGNWKKRCEILHSNNNNFRAMKPFHLKDVSWAIAMVEEYGRLRSTQHQPK